MEHRAFLVACLLTILFALVAVTLGDDVKHKKVIIKVPKKIKHIHHHHVKKVHIWKHKPKPIHSIHVVEEEEKVGNDWKEIFDKKKHAFSHWKHEKPIHEEYEEEEGEEYDEGHEEYHDGHKKSASNYEPVVWKGNKSSRKPRIHGNGKPKYNRNPRYNSGMKAERPKRQKHIPQYDDKWLDEPRYNKPKTRRPNSSSGKYGKTERRVKPKPYRPREYDSPDFKEYEYGEYDELNRNSPVWPERKEHISWHIRDSQPDPVMPEQGKASHSFLNHPEPNYFNSDYQTEYNGEINLAEEPLPDIPVVPPPKLAPQYAEESPRLALSQFQKPLLIPNFSIKPEKPINPGLPSIDYRKAPPPKELKVKNQDSANRFRTKLEQEGGVFSSYSSHVGHNADGDSASYQSVRFGPAH